MKVIQIRPQEDCFDGSLMKVVLFDKPISRTFIEFMGEIGKLDYFPSFARPFFRVEVKGFYYLKGIENDTSLSLILYKKDPDKSMKLFMEHMKKFENEISILVVDDSPVVRMIIRKMLDSEKLFQVKVIEASNAQIGFDMYKLTQPDLIITDYNMPGMNGFEFIARIRKTDPLKQIPIILLTGEENKEMVASFSDSTDFIYLQKPFMQNQLTELLLDVLNKKICPVQEFNT